MRRLVLQSPWLAALLLLATLAARLMVPTGYMVAQQDGHAAIVLCPGAADAAPVAMTGMHHGMASDHAPSPTHDKPEPPCAFAGLSLHALGSADPLLLAVLIAFVLALGTRSRPTPLSAPRLYWRPPSHGPPTA
ncbi:hypothetical protein Q5H91_04575 [Sphingomonas sp. KR1UV-12]|uniref:DUF2946 domain-containing protein n=1 Tax=Sphingomonas aurea TaxID=3063994 RepID=A0ABT9EHN0_9SPHN|nr:hypothetical protein [Sphingomonas sp. KR1UV-12]MDP1026478.1 hypothetical protein [Sphingomonas sp. KR1UV-12]